MLFLTVTRAWMTETQNSQTLWRLLILNLSLQGSQKKQNKKRKKKEKNRSPPEYNKPKLQQVETLTK